MKKKTFEKLLRRFLGLPPHHIDTSILLEPEKTEDGRDCRKYLQKVGYDYRGKLSLPVFAKFL